MNLFLEPAFAKVVETAHGPCRASDPCFRTEQGYKPCKKPGHYRARLAGGEIRCPGCERVCCLPHASGVLHGDMFWVER